MPRHDGCCRFGSPEAPASAIKLPTFLDAELWRRNDWLPDVYKTGHRSGFFDQAIASAQRIKSALGIPLANRIEQVWVVGTGIDTRLHLYIDPADTGWRRWRFSSDKGDGTVPIWSAAQGLVTSASPAFSPHASIFEDRWVAQRITWLLSDVAPPEVTTLEALVMTVGGQAKSINRVHAGIVPEVGPPGSEATLNVFVLAVERLNRGSLAPVYSLSSQSGQLLETTEDVDLVSSTLTFTAKFARPIDPGIYRVDIRFGPESRHAVYLVVQ